MKTYNILNQSNQIVATIQVDDSTAIDELQHIYGGTVVESTQTIQPQPGIDDLNLQARSLRNQLLEEIDAVSAVWYAALTQQQQQELKTYRQALLDVPQQTGFPEVTEWPTKPHWL